ncbi:MAG: TonB-dependent receptor [Vicinamibacterales bacterium]
MTTFSWGRVWAGVAAAILLLSAAVPARAQGGATLSGTVTRDAGDAMAGAAVVIEELKRETRTGADGTYRFEGVAPGDYHVSVRAEGYSSHRTEVTVTPRGATLDLVVALDMHFAETVSVSPNARPQFESYQPTSVLAGQELQKQLESTIGATLQSEPGVAMRSLGPAPARPVIRGMDGDRVVVLEDGQRVGDLSSQSGDHGVSVNPSSAQRIEVVRGPAALLYGASAIGGLVNVITDQIPTKPQTAATGDFTLDLASNAGDAGGAGDVHFGNGQLAFHVSGAARRTGNYSTPEGEVDNSDSRSATASVGASWTREKTYVGTSYSYDDSRYGVPIVEGGEISLAPTRHAFTLRAGGEGLDGAVTSYRATFGVRRYEHTEFEGQDAGTIFHNNTEEGELLVSHKAVGRLSGTVGGWFLDRAFDAIGEEALSPPIDQSSLAGFIYEELTWPHATVQFGGRLDHTSYDPKNSVLPARDYNEFSTSVGLLVRPIEANDDFVVAMSLARAARNPALEELYFYGTHVGNLSFEIGNPDLGAETALGFDLSLRTRLPRLQGELTFFRNGIKDFIFRNPLSAAQFAARQPEFNARFGKDEDNTGSDFQYIEYTGADATMYGVEAHGDIVITPTVTAEVTYDWVKGELSGSGDPLPRIPPYRVSTGLRYQKNAFQAGGTVTAVSDQNRVFGEETPTAGYATLKFFGSYSFVTDRLTHTITARLDNATDRLYRNHLNYLKDVLPEMGRNFKLVYSVQF